MNATRRFEILPGYREAGIALPRRATPASAGYDLACAETAVIAPGAVGLVPTGVRAWIPAGEFLEIHIRSSVALRRGLVLANGTGVIDSDYAGNPENGGHILLALRNLGSEPARLERGERVAQGIFLRYLTTDDDRPGAPRSGGFGSTGARA